jgi:multidrug resistance efflux pump
MKRLLLGILLLTACREEAPINYQLHTVQKGALELTIPQTGELGSAREVSVSAPFAGTLSQLKPEGSVIKKGETLGRIETTSQEQERSNAQLAISEGQLDLKLAALDGKRRDQENRSKQGIADLDAKLESLRLKQLQQERDPVALTQLQESLRSLAQQREILELEARERTRLFGLGYLSRQERDQAQLQLGEAKQQQLQLEAELKILKAGPRKQEVAQQQLAVQRTRDEQRRVKQEKQANQRVVGVQKRSADARIKKYQQRFGYYNNLIRSGTLTAPAAGTLIYGKIEIGEDMIPIKSGDALQEGVQIGRLVDLQQPLVRMMVHEIDAPRIKVGQDVRLTFDTYPETTYPGKVSKILPVARQTLSEDEQKVRSFSCEVELLKKDPRLKPGMTAQAEIITQRFASALLVPTQAINGSDVWVMVKDKPQRRAIKTGSSDARMTQVLSGLSLGDRVILNPLAVPSTKPAAVEVSPEASKAVQP